MQVLPLDGTCLCLVLSLCVPWKGLGQRGISGQTFHANTARVLPCHISVVIANIIDLWNTLMLLFFMSRN